MTRDEPAPSICELCGFDFESEPEPELSAPALGSDRAKVIDASIRQQAAALGQTNFKTQLRHGDVAAVPVNNPVSQFVAQQQQMGVPNYGGGSVGSLLANTKPADNLGGRPALAAIQRGEV